MLKHITDHLPKLAYELSFTFFICSVWFLELPTDPMKLFYYLCLSTAGLAFLLTFIVIWIAKNVKIQIKTSFKKVEKAV